MPFISGSTVGSAGATLAPVSGCAHAAFVLRRGPSAGSSVVGLVFVLPSAKACGALAVRLAGAAGLWYRTRRIARDGRPALHVIRVGVRSRLLARGVDAPVLLRAVAVGLAGAGPAAAAPLVAAAYAPAAE